MDETLWMEAIATTIVGKAPRSWVDDDRIRFEIGLAEISRNIRHLEALLFEEQKRLTSGKKLEEIYRIGIADRHSMEVGAVVAVEKHEQKRFIQVVIELQERIADLGVSPQIALAALACVSQSLLSEYNGNAEPARQEAVARVK